MKQQRKFVTSGQKNNTYLCTVTPQANGESILVCRESGASKKSVGHAHVTDEKDLAQKFVQDVAKFQALKKVPVFNAGERRLVKAAATITSPVPGVADNCLQYEMTTQDGYTVFLREWLKPDDGSSAFSRQHSNSTQSLLMMPGFPHAAMLVWNFQVNDKYLSENYRMVTMEIRGHGDSSKPMNSADFAEQKWADDIQDAITLLNLYNPVLMSHSHSGTLVSHYLNVYGESSLGGIILTSSFTKLDLTNGTWVGETFDPKFLALAADFLNLTNDLGTYYRANHTFADLSFHKIPDDNYFIDGLAVDSFMSPATRQPMLLPPRYVDNTVLGTVTIPAMVVHADDNCGVNEPKCKKSRDDLIILQHAIDGYNLLQMNSSNASLKIMKGVGHFPQAEDPHKYNHLLKDFLANL